MLNGLIGFLLNDPIDANMDEQISIEDYFILQQLQLNVIEHGKYELGTLFAIDNPGIFLLSTLGSDLLDL